MRLFAAAVFLLLLFALPSPYKIKQTRDQMLGYYYANIDEKVPTSARMLIGDEKINIYIAGQPVGIETRRGQLYSFEMFALDKPTIVVTVSEEAADKISKKQLGVLQAIDSGLIRIETRSFFSALKVEMMKRIYAVSGVDDQLLGKRQPQQPYTSNSMLAQRARIVSSLFAD